MYGCLHPKKVYNKHIDEEIWTKCGRCDHCVNIRANILTQRIERELVSNLGTCLFITLDYRNEDLPLYVYDDLLCRWTSNREGFPVLGHDAVDTYARPVRIREKRPCFGHLAYIDTLKYFKAVRQRFRLSVKGDNRSRVTDRNNINLYFKGYKVEDFKIRYFLCGEYGPTTCRPHYHALVWFGSRFTTDQQLNFISKIMVESWPYGHVDVRPVISQAVDKYLASYLTGVNNLPSVLRDKPLKPFCVFSKAPTIGSYKLSPYEIQEFLTSGTFERFRWSQTKQEYTNEQIEQSFYRRYAPKCTGFNTKTRFEKLRIYSYVEFYFNNKKIRHTAKDLDDLKLVDVDWPEEWGYLDKYASMYAYKMTILLDWSYIMVLDAIERVYEKLASSSLGSFYEEQEELSKNNHNEYCVQLRYSINWDLEFLSTLPKYVYELELYQIYALESYGFDILELYPDDELIVELLDTYHYGRDPSFIEHKKKQTYDKEFRVKKKKENDYKNKLNSNIKVFSYG